MHTHTHMLRRHGMKLISHTVTMSPITLPYTFRRMVSAPTVGLQLADLKALLNQQLCVEYSKGRTECVYSELSAPSPSVGWLTVICHLNGAMFWGSCQHFQYHPRVLKCSTSGKHGRTQSKLPLQRHACDAVGGDTTLRHRSSFLWVGSLVWGSGLCGRLTSQDLN